MSVTAMYVELLVVGLGGLIWAVLFIFTGHSDKLITLLSSLNFEHNTAVILPFALSAAYVLGILIDKASKCIMEFHKLFTDNDAQKYEKIIVESESATTVLNYMRSKIRIMRGYIFNWSLIGISGHGYLSSVTSHQSLSRTVFLAGMALTTVTLVLYFFNNYLYNKRIEKFGEALKNKSEENDSTQTCKTEKQQQL